MYEECERAMQDVLDKIDFGWYDKFFGPRNNSSFKIYLGIITGPANYDKYPTMSDFMPRYVEAKNGCDK